MATEKQKIEIEIPDNFFKNILDGMFRVQVESGIKQVLSGDDISSQIKRYLNTGDFLNRIESGLIKDLNWIITRTAEESLREVLEENDIKGKLKEIMKTQFVSDSFLESIAKKAIENVNKE